MNWPIKLQAPSCKQLTLDRSLDLGYCRIKKKEKRTYAKLNASRPRTVVTRRNKPARARNWQPRTRVITSVYKLSNQLTQSTSPQAKGSSFKPEATSSRILEPGYKRTSLGSGEPATRTNEFFGWDTKKLIWWGDRRTLLTFVNLSSTRNQFPL